MMTTSKGGDGDERVEVVRGRNGGIAGDSSQETGNSNLKVEQLKE
jgi:hypothetical protein